jgi:hypothetical protein
MDRRTHKRFLEYRERATYFGKSGKTVDAATFAALDAELEALEIKGEARDDEEDARFAELLRLLLRD